MGSSAKAPSGGSSSSPTGRTAPGSMRFTLSRMVSRRRGDSASTRGAKTGPLATPRESEPVGGEERKGPATEARSRRASSRRAARSVFTASIAKSRSFSSRRKAVISSRKADTWAETLRISMAMPAPSSRFWGAARSNSRQASIVVPPRVAGSEAGGGSRQLEERPFQLALAHGPELRPAFGEEELVADLSSRGPDVGDLGVPAAGGVEA